MGITERKERNKQEMRGRILSTAMKFFLEEGFENVSIRRIADKIEYSPATIYLYFKDKNEILFALHNEGFEKFHKQQQEALKIKDIRKRIRKHGELYIRFALENPEYYNLMFIMRSPVKRLNEGEKWFAGMKAYETFRNDVERGMNSGVLKKTDVDIATFSLWASCHGIAALILRNRCPMLDQNNLQAIAQKAFDSLLKNMGLAS